MFGETVASVIEKDPRYALWAHRNVEFFKLGASQIQDCMFRSDAAPFLPRSPLDDDDDDCDEAHGMSYADFGNN